MGLPRFLTATLIVAAALLLLLVVPARSAPPGGTLPTPGQHASGAAGDR